MITFILIFFVMIIVVGIAAVAGFSIYLTTRRRKSLGATAQKQFEQPTEGYRSLFAPSAEETSLLKREAETKRQAAAKEAESRIAFEKAEAVREFEKIWRGAPTRQNTVELMQLAVISESAELFSRTAESVIQVTRYEPAGGLSKEDLADLLDSHLRILPQQERFSGATFWLRQEIENLRRKSEAKS